MAVIDEPITVHEANGVHRLAKHFDRRLGLVAGLVRVSCAYLHTSPLLRRDVGQCFSKSI